MSANALAGDSDQHIQTATVPQVEDHFNCTIKIEETLKHSEVQIRFSDRETFPITGNGKGGSSVSGKIGIERKISGATAAFTDDKLRAETDSKITELLGSVTTHNCPGTRASARVIQKMKQDQTRPTTPPPNEREQLKREEKTMQKTPSQLRSIKPTWTNLERNHFFDALNEFGKDFEALGNYINTKLKRRSVADGAFKTKDQVRQHYYQTYHKICKYIKFSDEVKKPVQELYALINFGEMRRKLQFVTDKHFMKLRNLVYQGHITVRCKGKNLRIKTPSCKALRRLNQLDDSLEDIRLPSKIEVIVSPTSMEAFGRVQSVAQNPRVRTTVPLHKKLVNFIKTFQLKWRSAEQKLAEEELKLFPPANAPVPLVHSAECNGQQTAEAQERVPAFQDPEMCFLPKPGVAIHRPLLSITEYLSSGNICLAAYEERMGVKIRGESLCQERAANKRPRTESGSEKRSPDSKKSKQFSSPPHDKIDCDGHIGDAVIMEDPGIQPEQELTPSKGESSSDELSDELHELLNTDLDDGILMREESDNANDYMKAELAADLGYTSHTNSHSSNSNIITSGNQGRMRRSANTRGSCRSSAPNFKPLISEEVIRNIRKGWTASTTADITIGDLYVVLGHDSKLELEYYWTDRPQQSSAIVNTTSSLNTLSYASIGNSNCSNNSCAMVAVNVSGSVTSSANALDSMSQLDTTVFMQKQNGMPYNPNECDDPELLKSLSDAGVANKLKHLLLIANLSERIRKRQCSCGHTCDRNVTKTRLERNLATKTYISTKTFTPNNANESNNVFRQPVVPIRRPLFNMDSVKQLNTMTRQKQSPRQVLVQRMLLPSGSAVNQSYDVLNVKKFQNNITDMPSSVSGESQTSQQSCGPSKASATVSDAAEVTTADEVNHNEAPISTAAHINSIANSYDDHNANQLDIVVPSALLDNTPTSSASYETAAPNSDNADLSLSATFPDSAFDECTSTSSFNGIIPTHLLRESTSNSRWLEENLNDFSLTSLLGHLDEINASRDIVDPSSNLSVISESSVDYMHKFQEITALMQSQEKD